MLRRTGLLVLALAVLAPSCARPPGLFSEQNARVHVGMLAGTIGSRPIGTPANQRAREYIVDQLRLSGFEVRVQETDARRPELGRTARVHNIIATLQGSRPEAIGLVAHYDSRPDTPGAADDALGVAVALEAARVAASRADPQWSVLVLLTDGEEAGLMGAAALMTDRDVTRRLAAYLQVEAIGSAGPALLFETGPANAWILSPWARRAPHPRGASYALEVYQRLPSDTDFSIIKRQGIPGLNFAPVGDSYAYHTMRDTPERLSPRTVRSTGENVVAILEALDKIDITQRSTARSTYFDLGGTVGVTYGGAVGRVLSVAALLLGIVAWVRVTAAAVRLSGMLRWLLTLVWCAVGAALAVAAMIGATWALRAAREVYHPWYARPDRLFLLLVATGAATGWAVSRLGSWLPARAHGLRHPLMVWSVTLPSWIALAFAALWLAPAAAYLWIIPLFAAGLLLSVVPPTSAIGIRAASLVVFGVTASLWLRETIDLLRFMVATFGRLATVTPVFVYAALMAVSALMLVPPLAGAFAAARRLLRPSLVTTGALIAIALAAGLAYQAPSYTAEAPLRRTVRALQAAPDGPATWEVGSTEPGLDLAPGAPDGWELTTGAPSAGWPWPRLAAPFVFRAQGPALGPAPVYITRATLAPVASGAELTIAVVPRQTGLTVSFVLPPGVIPARHNLPGVVRGGVWAATFVAVPAEGVLFRASVNAGAAGSLERPLVLVSSARLPGGEGWQSLPAWLPQERTAWTASASWAVAVPVAAAVAPSLPLR